jgi:hypothetical protein
MDPELVALVKRLRRRNPKTGERKSLRAIAADLANLGHVNVNGRPFAGGVDPGDGAGMRGRRQAESPLP